MILAAWPDTVEGWVGLIVLTCSLIGAIAALVPTIIKLVKALKTIVKEKNWKKIIEVIKNAILAAESTARTGASKKELVIETVKQFCKDMNIEIDEELLKQISDYIDEYIKLHNDLERIEKCNKAGK